MEGPRKGIRPRWATSFSKIWQQLFQPFQLIQPLKIIKKKKIQQNINTIPENRLKEIGNLSASLEKLSVSHQEPLTLKKNTKVQSHLKTAMNGEKQHLF